METPERFQKPRIEPLDSSELSPDENQEQYRIFQDRVDHIRKGDELLAYEADRSEAHMIELNKISVRIKDLKAERNHDKKLLELLRHLEKIGKKIMANKFAERKHLKLGKQPTSVEYKSESDQMAVRFLELDNVQERKDFDQIFKELKNKYPEEYDALKTPLNEPHRNNLN